MLILSRQRDEDVLIGEDIIVTVVDIRGDKVRLGFAAPESVRIDRREVREAMTVGPHASSYGRPRGSHETP